MTEGQIDNPVVEPIEPCEEEECCQLWGALVTKSQVRLKIWQILELFGELNVTQISNLLKESKSTVSRHLNSMLEDSLVRSRKVESTCDGRIAPKLFSINHDTKKMKSGMDQSDGFPEDPAKQVEFIKSEIQTNRSSIAMISGIMKLLLPIYDEVENLIKQNTPESLENAKSIFMEYMWGEKGENITWFKFAYQSPLMYQLEVKIHDWSYKGLKDEYDPIQFEEERIKLKARLKEAKAQQDNPSISKKYARLGIDLPLRKIFKKNMNK